MTFPTRIRNCKAQQGAAAILLLVLIILGSLYAVLGGLNSATADLHRQRDDVTQEALRQAKEGLMAWAARRNYQPGAFPCPDTDGDGYADTDVDPANSVLDSTLLVIEKTLEPRRHDQPLAGGWCSTAGRRIGRLPWRTLGLPDLRDASGEQLWYAMSDSFRALLAREINSDTPGELKVREGDPTASVGPVAVDKVIAIVLAPGAAVGGQDRSAANLNDPAQYFEGENRQGVGGDVADNFVRAPRCEAADCPGGLPFNDQMILVTTADFFPVLETVVQKRIEEQIKPKLQEYFTNWTAPTANGAGFFPFAAPYSDASFVPPDPSRPQDNYLGNATPSSQLTHGLLPITANAAWVSWTTPPADWVGPWTAPVLAKVSGSGDFVLPAPNCTPTPTATTCTFSYQGNGLVISFSGRRANVARALALPIVDADITKASSMVSGTSSLTQSVDAQGHATVTYTFRVADTGFPTSDSFTLPTPFSTLAQSNDTTTGWFVRNGWYRQTYYAVSPAVVAGGSGTGNCAPPPSVAPPPCLRVENLADANNDRKEAVLVLAGRGLGAVPRSWAVANYFESDNATSPAVVADLPDYIFKRDLRSGAFNDRLVVVR
jgi:hypothetical protein